MKRMTILLALLLAGMLAAASVMPWGLPDTEDLVPGPTEREDGAVLTAARCGKDVFPKFMRRAVSGAARRAASSGRRPWRTEPASSVFLATEKPGNW